jgi:hypothetical protein
VDQISRMARHVLDWKAIQPHRSRLIHAVTLPAFARFEDPCLDSRTSRLTLEALMPYRPARVF